MCVTQKWLTCSCTGVLGASRPCQPLARMFLPPWGLFSHIHFLFLPTSFPITGMSVSCMLTLYFGWRSSRKIKKQKCGTGLRIVKHINSANPQFSWECRPRVCINSLRLWPGCCMWQVEEILPYIILKTERIFKSEACTCLSHFNLLQHWEMLERHLSPPLVLLVFWVLSLISHRGCFWKTHQPNNIRPTFQSLLSKCSLMSKGPLVISNIFILCFFFFLKVWSFMNAVLATWNWKEWEDALQVDGVNSLLTVHQ